MNSVLRRLLSRPTCVVQAGRLASSCRLNFDEDCERSINSMINAELDAMFAYQLMAFHFNRDDVALPGFSRYFREASLEERGHAEKFMEYQNKRGGRIKLEDIKRPDVFEWDSGLDAMKTSLKMEMAITTKLYDLHAIADEKGDAQMADFIEGEFLKEQVDEIKKVADHITRLERVGRGLGEHQYDMEVLGGRHQLEDPH